MRRRILLLTFLMTIVIPGIVCSRLSKWQEIQTGPEPTTTIEEGKLLVSVLSEGKVIQMELEDYIQCVVLGEIPNDFEQETLKAQAVATRTYTLQRMRQSRKHDEAFLCTDSSCCQAFFSPSAYLTKGGSEEYLDRIQEAVASTSGEILLYNGDLIEATYFAASGGRTEAAVEVWGKDLPYLQSVDSPGEQARKYDNRCVQFTPQDFLEKLGLPTEKNTSISCTNIRYTPGNGVSTITVCGKEYTGKVIRELLGLPSTIFTITVSEDCITITTDGNGHRVGMSQYGADAMAVEGNGYKEILAHYYPGTTLYRMTNAEIKGIFDKAGIL